MFRTDIVQLCKKVFNELVYSHFNWLEQILFAQASLYVSGPQEKGPKVGNSLTHR